MPHAELDRSVCQAQSLGALFGAATTSGPASAATWLVSDTVWEEFGEPFPEATLQHVARNVRKGSIEAAQLPEGWVTIERVLPDDVVPWMVEQRIGSSRDPREIGGAAPV